MSVSNYGDYFVDCNKNIGNIHTIIKDSDLCSDKAIAESQGHDFDAGIYNVDNPQYNLHNTEANTDAQNSFLLKMLILALFTSFLCFSQNLADDDSESKPVESYSNIASDANFTQVSDSDILSNGAVVTSENLRNKFGFNISQWAKILGVERKTLYNWKKNNEIRINKNIEENLNILNQFSREFDDSHKFYFAKMIFGNIYDEDLARAFTAPKLDLNVLLKAYYDSYSILDGYVTRSGIV
ncbi:hypothetical protein [Providencia vermicola]|uniref:hypothetical protein n=1 Tax=Providencia vermicola TaxID=333965 RepID=UPI0034E56C0E